MAEAARSERVALLQSAPWLRTVRKILIPLRIYSALVKQAALAWIKDDASSMGAALAFYSAFSLAPLLLIVMALAGVFYGPEQARTAVVSQFSALIGPVGADAIGGLLKAAAVAETGLVATVVGVVLLLVGATTVLVELESDLDRIWEAPPRKDSGIVSLLRVRVLSFGLILGIGFLLIVSLVASSAIAATGARWNSSMLGTTGLVIADFALAVVIFTALFGMLYKWLPNVRIAWDDVWVGALTTAVLFNLGRLAIGAYLGRSATGSAYAAAGSALVLLLWLYYSAQIFLFGAEFTWVRAKHRRGLRAPKTVSAEDYQSPG
jgi:membrane protein